jgi:peptidoglycan hydrolase-like protein with peptidoglycan-binding domain/DNA invertase Pin-like site-specific DNA recombinase
MFGKKGSSAAGSGLMVLLVGLALALCALPAAAAAEQTQGSALLARGAGYGTPGGSGPVEDLQRRLQTLGESPGPVDGIFGPLTEGAVVRLQLRTGLAADGIVGAATRKALRTADPRPIRAGEGVGVAGGSPRVKQVQRQLRAAGYPAGPVDGKFGPQTELAVNSLQGKSDLVVDGVVGPSTRAALTRLRDDGSRQVKEEQKQDEQAKQDTERRGSEQAPQAPTDERPAGAKPAAAPTEGGSDSDVPWIPIAIALGVLGVAAALFLLRDRLPRRKPPTTVIPLGRGIDVEGESGDPDIGRFRGTAYAVEMPDVDDAELRAEASRFFVLDPRHRLPFWVAYDEVESPLPPALQAHPGPWSGVRALRPGTPVLGYVTVPKAVPERQSELYDQLARIESLCKRRRFELLGVVRDVEVNGGDVMQRPGVRYALERFDSAEARALVVCDMSRLAGSRRQLDTLLEQLDDRGVALVALEPEVDTSTAEGRQLVQQLELVRSEREKLDGSGRRVDPELAARIVGLRDRGESLQAIADALNEERVPPPGGFKWRPRSVRNVLARNGDAPSNVVPLASRKGGHTG